MIYPNDYPVKLPHSRKIADGFRRVDPDGMRTLAAILLIEERPKTTNKESIVHLLTQNRP